MAGQECSSLNAIAREATLLNVVSIDQTKEFCGLQQYQMYVDCYPDKDE